MRKINNRYELRTLLGQGSMGQVWQAWDIHLKRAIAIKVISPERLANPGQGLTTEDIMARFRREAELGARFTHPNMPVLHDAELQGGGKDLYMVWELVLGRNLSEILADNARVPLRQALLIAQQTAHVLASLHSYPVIHRDVKPANIMITDMGSVKILDLGIAAVFGTANPQLTQPGQLLGTVAYMAPEQFSGKPVIPQTDLYALGCVMYEMLAGQPPYTGDPVVIMDGHRNGTPVPLQTLHPDLPPRVTELVMSLLAKEPTKRPASARIFLDQLDPLCVTARETTSATPQKSTPTDSTAAPELPAAIRKGQALALFHDGHFGKALPLYTALSAELAEAGPDHATDAAECRANAAHCHLRLGNVEHALGAYISLAETLPKNDPLEPLLLDVQCEIALLQEMTGRPAALESLAHLYPILDAHLGRDAPRTSQVRAALNRAAAR
ncbi:serine/threonine-protein kinase [Streptomyces sp. NPDC059095]|uniref:serine/threonine-protein kinase n=1 Tax=Streptomyces sp. NPDC059095 TaxID=3346726 RepID=UPI00367CDAD6